MKGELEGGNGRSERKEAGGRERRGPKENQLTHKKVEKQQVRQSSRHVCRIHMVS